MKSIQLETGARISIPRNDGPIRITGTIQAINAAKMKIQSISMEQTMFQKQREPGSLTSLIEHDLEIFTVTFVNILMTPLNSKQQQNGVQDELKGKNDKLNVSESNKISKRKMMN